MCSPGYFEMLACDYKLNNNIEIPGCLRYISNITYNSGDQRYCRTFNSGLKYVREKPDGLNKLKFYFKINTTEAEAEELGVALITLDFIPHNFNPLLKMDKAVELRLQLQGIFVPAIVDRVSLNPFNMPIGTNGYFSISPGDFIVEETSEKRYCHEYPCISLWITTTGFVRRISIDKWYLLRTFIPQDDDNLLNDEIDLEKYLVIHKNLSKLE
ncbi:10516_t:CDS:2 [Rhizophagus irregularis]|nr:10516_t:CDS:2 [Rhizophagus irregularis]